MVKQIFFFSAVFLFLGMATPSQAQTGKGGIRFLEDISVNTAYGEVIKPGSGGPKAPVIEAPVEVKRPVLVKMAKAGLSMIETATSLQFKYALLLDVEVEAVSNLKLFRVIDEWFGTRYVYGGTGKAGIDCSALMQVFFSALYGMALPRTAREQYAFSRKISRTELQEGDLVFFNTRGGVSHVGMYLQDNKFVNAATSGGVSIGDLNDEYWAKRFIGAGRVNEDVQPGEAPISTNEAEAFFDRH